MRAITLWQPWATLMVLGIKQIETRGWYTNYRGPLAIHAAVKKPLRFDDEAGAAIDAALLEAGLWYDKLPLGKVIGYVHLVSCIKVKPGRLPGYPERLFGNYEVGRYAWVCRDARRYLPEVPAVGQQRLWEWDASRPNPSPRQAALFGRV